MDFHSKAPHPAALAHAARTLPPELFDKLPPALQALAQRATVAPLSPDDQRKAGVLAYLHDERALIATRLAQGMEPYSYLPTIIGNITAGVLTWGDLDDGELEWVVDEYTRQLRDARAWPGGDAVGETKAQAVIDVAQAELAKRGVLHVPPPEPERAPLTVPPVDHSGGR